ncbi:MAG TPA: hypothetical protein VJ576_09870 [Rhodocyclaceae bacterium]|nr:hypothetical protein [Rhodocyclaceae bacterium]
MKAPAILSRRASGLVGAGLLLLCLPAWWIDRTALLAAWLVALLFCLDVALGGLANVWVHNLTGGAWGEAIRVPLLTLGRALPALAVLFLPVLAGLPDLYPWAAGGNDWSAELSAPAFKDAWLTPGAFALRAVVVLLLWNALAWASRRPAWGRARGFAAGALIVYGLSLGLAAVDWLMSLTPLWYSSIFGLAVGVGQVLAGLAFAAVAACRREEAVDASTRRDLGNLLLAYVLTWGYLAFSQFLIIWSENLPHEISWYVMRRDGGWLALGIAVAVLQFALPLLALLFRAVKDSPRRLGWLAGGLLAAHFLDVCWLVLPSVGRALVPWHLLWLLPLTALGLPALCYGLLPPTGELHHA